MTTQTITAEPDKTPHRNAPEKSSGLAAAALKTLPSKMSPLAQARNPVMFVVWVGAALTTVWSILNPSFYGWVVTVWLWFTIAFAAFAEAYAEAVARPKQTVCALCAMMQLPISLLTLALKWSPRPS